MTNVGKFQSKLACRFSVHKNSDKVSDRLDGNQSQLKGFWRCLVEIQCTDRILRKVHSAQSQT